MHAEHAKAYVEAFATSVDADFDGSSRRTSRRLRGADVEPIFDGRGELLRPWRREERERLQWHDVRLVFGQRWWLQWRGQQFKRTRRSRLLGGELCDRFDEVRTPALMGSVARRLCLRLDR